MITLILNLALLAISVVLAASILATFVAYVALYQFGNWLRLACKREDQQQ